MLSGETIKTEMVEKLSADKIINSPEKSAQSESSKMFNDQAIELNFLRNRLETFQTTVLRDVQKRMSGMIDEVMQELRQHELQTNEFRNFAKPQMSHQKSNTWSNRISSHSETVSSYTVKSKEKTLNDDDTSTTTSSTNERLTSNAAEDVVEHARSSHRTTTATKKLHALPDKVFIMRESFLTALLEVDHMKTIYHIFYIIFLVFLLNNISYEYLVKGSVSLGLGTFKAGFANIHYIFGIWLLQHAFVFSVYYALQGWSSIRAKLAKQEPLQHTWSVACIVIYACTQIIFAYIPAQICLKLSLPFASASALLCESIRLLMKMHGFVRTIAGRVVSEKLKTEDVSKPRVNLPPFEIYLYFLFAPTLIYRDSYPRTSIIRWKFALARFFEVVAVAFLYSYIYERHIKIHFGNFGQEDVNAASITVKLFGMLMPGIIIFLCGFYMILHAWLNFTAEILRFGDRMFYKDWWTASNYEAYYRNWNVVVHDWLYEYIYKDFYTHIFKGSKGASSLTVFFISALFHEYILGYALQILFPVMFVFFGIIGVAMIFLTRLTPKTFGNILIWFSLVYGNCILVSLYSMEYFTSLNCPKVNNSWWDHLVPHLWSCYYK